MPRPYNLVCPCGNLSTTKRSGQNCCARCAAIEDSQPQNKSTYNAGAKHNRYQSREQTDIGLPTVDAYHMSQDTGKTPVRGGRE